MREKYTVECPALVSGRSRFGILAQAADSCNVLLRLGADETAHLSDMLDEDFDFRLPSYPGLLITWSAHGQRKWADRDDVLHQTALAFGHDALHGKAATTVAVFNDVQAAKDARQRLKDSGMVMTADLLSMAYTREKLKKAA